MKLSRLCCLLLVAGLAFVSACKEKKNEAPPSEPYRFLVTSHVYGSWRNLLQGDSLYPGWIGEWPTLETKDLEFGVIMGDLFSFAAPDQYQNYISATAGYPLPTFYVPGNHDLEWTADGPDFTLFNQHFNKINGPRWLYGDLFWLLDSNREHWDLDPDAEEELELSVHDERTRRNVFLFTHNILWWDSLDPVFQHPRPNSYWNHLPGDFHTDLLKKLHRWEEHEFWFFAGDTGNHCDGKNLTIHHDGNVHLVTTGIGCPTESAYLIVEVDAKERVHLSIHNLAGSTMSTDLADYEY